MMKNRVLEKFQAGEKSIGTFSHLQSTVAIECLGLTGLDFVVIDMEHSPVTAEGVDRYIVAARSAGIDPFVRVDEVSRAPILMALDAGAQGVIVPCVETMDQVEHLVEYAKFAPLGSRGFCPTRDGGWGRAQHAGSMEEYMRTSNQETLLILQCETLGCLELIERIANFKGIDGILIGPFDLSIALGKPGRFDDPQFAEALHRILAACKSAEKICMIFAGSADDARMYFAAGYDSAAVGLDTDIYIRSYCDIVQSSR